MLGLLVACDTVHEFPEEPKEPPYAKLLLRLKYATEMPIQEHYYQTRSTDSIIDRDIRYLIKAYPVLADGRTSQEVQGQFLFSRDAAMGYDYDCWLDLPPGRYNIMVWSDLVAHGSQINEYYNADNFTGIHLQGEHAANTDYRDAFRGSKEITLVTEVMQEVQPDTMIIDMVRPLAKFEFITNDLVEFMDKETRAAGLEDSLANTRINLEDYKVVFYYSGFMPNEFSLFTDKPVDSATGVSFESKLTPINEKEASMGFDYIFISDKSSVTTVMIGIFNAQGELLSMTNPIEVPIDRSWHTIMRGRFLMSEASGGIVINPDFEGDHNIVIP